MASSTALMMPTAPEGRVTTSLPATRNSGAQTESTAFSRFNKMRFHHVRARLVLQECEARGCVQNQRVSHGDGPPPGWR